mmetsp:Transcript_25416/g.82200  ORF Transcript_25416/g.82200 Transcript_25416/m.82200 type:complete len:201 (+) Transcript_25416:3658-4260(+)
MSWSANESGGTGIVAATEVTPRSSPMAATAAAHHVTSAPACQCKPSARSSTYASEARASASSAHVASNARSASCLHRRARWILPDVAEVAPTIVAPRSVDLANPPMPAADGVFSSPLPVESGGTGCFSSFAPATDSGDLKLLLASLTPSSTAADVELRLANKASAPTFFGGDTTSSGDMSTADVVAGPPTRSSAEPRASA